MDRDQVFDYIGYHNYLNNKKRDSDSHPHGWYEYEGRYFMALGVIQICGSPAMCDLKHYWTDPPKFGKAIKKWLKAHPEVKHSCDIEWEFPSAELRQEFVDTFRQPLTDEQIRKYRRSSLKTWIRNRRVLSQMRKERGITENDLVNIGNDD